VYRERLSDIETMVAGLIPAISIWSGWAGDGESAVSEAPASMALVLRELRPEGAENHNRRRPVPRNRSWPSPTLKIYLFFRIVLRER
jgi:hypothetical protein